MADTYTGTRRRRTSDGTGPQRIVIDQRNHKPFRSPVFEKGLTRLKADVEGLIPRTEVLRNG